MRKVSNSYQLITLVLAAICLQCARNEDQLIQVVDMFRHGARGPIRDSYDSKDQAYMSGQLTDVGQNQHFQLGNQMRNEYILDRNFLRDYYNHTEMIVYSTDVNRTIMSAQAHLLGMFPPSTGPKISVSNQKLLIPQYSNLTLKEIDSGYALPYGVNAYPIHTLSEYGPIIPFLCPNYDKLADRNLKNYADFIKRMDEKSQPIYKQVSEITGEQIKNISDLMAFEDVMTSDIYQERKLPSGLTDELIKKILQLRELKWFIYQSGDLARALQSMTFEYIIDQFQQKIHGNSTLKYIILSAHDTTLSRTMTYFNISNHECLWQKFEGQPITSLNCEDGPRYAANLIFELYSKEENPKEYYVMMKYNGKYLNLCEKKSTKCSWAEYKKRVNQNLGSYSDLCGINRNVEINEDNEGLIQALTFITIILAVVSAILAFALFKLKKQTNPQINSAQVITDPQKYVEMEQV